MKPLLAILCLLRLHSWDELPVTTALRKRGVFSRRQCSRCGVLQICKPILRHPWLRWYTMTLLFCLLCSAARADMPVSSPKGKMEILCFLSVHDGLDAEEKASFDKLSKEGLVFRYIDADTDRDTLRKYKVAWLPTMDECDAAAIRGEDKRAWTHGIPQWVLVVDGEEVERRTGHPFTEFDAIRLWEGAGGEWNSPEFPKCNKRFACPVDGPIGQPKPKTYPTTIRGPVIVMFTAKWCTPCKAMKPLVAALERTGVKFKVLDMEADEKTAVAYGIESVPVFLAIDKNGKVLDSIGGTCSSEELAAMWGKIK